MTSAPDEATTPVPPTSAKPPGSGSAAGLGSAEGFSEAERAAVRRVIAERRDMRTGFLPLPVDDALLTRVLDAAHRGPSVGLTQPWDFLIIRDEAKRERVRALAERQRLDYAGSLVRSRAARFDGMKVEAIREAPVSIVVTCDPTRGGPNPLGRRTQPAMAPYSVACAVQNLWLAARAEGLGIGWVSFFDERELAAELELPPHLEIVAYLCAGHVREFPPAPQLALSGWARRRPLAWAVHREKYGQRALPGEDIVDLIAQTVEGVRPLDASAMRDARELQDRLTKPPGALGVLEDVSVRLAGLAGTCPPPLPEPAAVAIFAADHGVHAQGVTPWPQEVTAQMVANFLAGGAVVNAFAGQVGAEVSVVDIGVAAPLPPAPGLITRKVAPGTADMTQGPAMTPEQARQAVETGIEVARDLVASGAHCLITGDMGIANTTASAALIAAFTGLPPEAVTGRGTGIDDATHARKVEVVRTALRLHNLDTTPPPDATSSGVADAAPSHGPDVPPQRSPETTPDASAQATRATPDASTQVTGLATGASEQVTGAATGASARVAGAASGEASGRGGVGGPAVGRDALEVLAAVGGLEHAGIAGFILGAAALQVPVVLDGVIAGAAALVATALCPDALGACIAGHRSAEPGHSAAVAHLGLRPLVDLELRLGEGTGALLALPLVQGAARVLHEVATFDSAGVSEKEAGK
ncbi:5,6-dimethylbenzimidazole synthase [Actinomadura rupiterrae]|uniref:5,6-dimethylbenzimidazole synthase n=1 Tax=Actinomadura rupiterrae TaxID=559627 RepID=UPI0020A5EA2F|nr:5,6-dimethylbenzimidazole synthase [Actinomadura rupiterrae]MCP2341919.1 nicotinate-nucleotide--dimethylbenzimidazole phosphoribosyltransferase [Actinomadura rupiterrae]